MIYTTNILLESLDKYANPATKLSRMVRDGMYFPITRGLYETNRAVPSHLLASSIYGPSYISFDYALNFYGMIPETVYTVTSATFEKKKKKKYETIFGTYSYRDVPSEVFAYDIRLMQEGDYFFRIGTPEKVLCDKLYTMPPVANADEIQQLLLDDLRIDEDSLYGLDTIKIEFLSQRYHTTNIKKLATFLRRLHR